jgi:GNAT superfamily N-acetyltransferase
MEITWRGEFTNEEVNLLHAEAFGHAVVDDDWRGLATRHSLGWVVAREEDGLVGFVNLPWDGLAHAWLQDVMVALRRRRRGLGKALVAAAVRGAREAGCEWLHVDFDEDLRDFYVVGCGFSPTGAGLIAL